MEYANWEKLERAKAEAHVTGGDVTEIYLRLGGKLVDTTPKVREVEKPKEAKKAKKK